MRIQIAFVDGVRKTFKIITQTTDMTRGASYHFNYVMPMRSCSIPQVRRDTLFLRGEEEDFDFTTVNSKDKIRDIVKSLSICNHCSPTRIIMDSWDYRGEEFVNNINITKG